MMRYVIAAAAAALLAPTADAQVIISTGGYTYPAGVYTPYGGVTSSGYIAPYSNVYSSGYYTPAYTYGNYYTPGYSTYSYPAYYGTTYTNYYSRPGVMRGWRRW
jgi:hypothetical protein